MIRDAGDDTPMPHRATLFFSLVAAALIAPDLRAGSPTPYESETQKWREDREARLKADGGWLTVAGLFWLEEGANRFGTDASNEIVLPEGSAPARAGVFEQRSGVTTVRVEQGVAI